MKNLVIVILALVIMVPWPIWAGPMMSPYLQPALSPDEAATAAPVLSAFVIYPVLLVLFGIAVRLLDAVEEHVGKTSGQYSLRPPAGVDTMHTTAHSAESERKREKSREQAEAAGDLLLTLAFIDADKKRK